MTVDELIKRNLHAEARSMLILLSESSQQLKTGNDNLRRSVFNFNNKQYVSTIDSRNSNIVFTVEEYVR